MKITRIEPPQDEAPAALVEVPEPDPALVETPEARAERQEAESAAISGTRALVLELQARLEAVEAELAAHLATTEQHRADAGRLTAEAESLKRQCRVAEQLLGKLG